jgi:hypothetical protein
LIASQNSQLLINKETTAGTYDAPANTDVVDFVEANFTLGGAGPQRRNMQHSKMTGITPSIPGGRWWTGTITTELKASASAGAEPEIKNLLYGAGFEGTEDAGVSWTYALFDDPCTSTNRVGLSIKLEEFSDGNQYILHGARNSMNLTFGNDQAVQCEWPVAGGYTEPADTSPTASPSYNSGTPLVKLSDTDPVLIGAYEPILRSGSISLNWTPTARPDMAGTSTNGYLALPMWLARTENIMCELVIEAEDETAYTVWGDWDAGTSATIELNFEAGDRALEIQLAESVPINITRQAGTPNTYTVQFSCTGCQLKFT